MEEFQKILDPKTVKFNLHLASLYLTAYELLKYAIIERIKDFFIDGFENNKLTIDEEKYKREVTQLDGNELIASCLWLKRHKAITDEDIKEIKNIRRQRNKIAHELPKILMEKNCEINIECFIKARDLLYKIETWWIKEVEIPTNPDLDNMNTDNDEIMPGQVIFIEYLIDIVKHEIEQKTIIHSN